MHTFKKLSTAVALAVGFAVAAPALVQAETETTVTTTTTKHHYMYYPEHEIYFAPDTKTYYWKSNGSWTSGTTLPPEDTAFVRSKGITIELDTDKPYERHDYVIAHYKNGHRDNDDR